MRNPAFIPSDSTTLLFYFLSLCGFPSIDAAPRFLGRLIYNVDWPHLPISDSSLAPTYYIHPSFFFDFCTYAYVPSVYCILFP